MAPTEISGVLYESLSESLNIFLRLAIGLKGGAEPARYFLFEHALPVAAVVGAGLPIPVEA